MGSHKIIFLGAGASKDLGLPLTNEILPEVLEQLDRGSLFEGRIRGADDDRKDLQGLFRTLMPGQAAGAPFITDLLSIVDHSIQQTNALAFDTKTFGASGAYQAPQDLVRLRMLLERSIYEVLKRKYPDGPVVDSSEEMTGESLEMLQSHAATKPVDRDVLMAFAGWIQRQVDSSERLTIVTTNYDLVPEQLWKCIRIQDRRIPVEDVDFGFVWRDPGSGQLHPRPAQPTLAIYKLHGSLNWLRCALCEHAYINPAGDIAYLGFDPEPSWHNTCHCSYWPLRHVMVAPSMVRDIRDANILQVWLSALEAMRVADEWCVIGYSMPAEDIAIRSLLIRAYRGRGYDQQLALRPGPKVTVVQKDERGVAPFNLLFGGVVPELGGLKEFLSRQK